MYILKSKAHLKALKLLLDRGKIRPWQYTVVASGVLQSAVEGLWGYDAIVDRWPETPKSILLRPVCDPQKMGFMNRIAYIVSADHDNLAELLQQKDSLDWQRPISFFRLPLQYHALLQEALLQHGGSLRDVRGEVSWCYIGNTAASCHSLPLADGFDLGPVPEQLVKTLEDYGQVPEAIFPNEFQNLTLSWLRHMPSSAIFDSRGRMVSWSSVSFEGAFTHGHTLPQHRSKDFIKVVTRHLMVELKKRGRRGFFFAKNSNKMSPGALQGLFDRVDEPVIYLRYEPKLA